MWSDSVDDGAARPEQDEDEQLQHVFSHVVRSGHGKKITTSLSRKPGLHSSNMSRCEAMHCVKRIVGFFWIAAFNAGSAKAAVSISTRPLASRDSRSRNALFTSHAASSSPFDTYESGKEHSRADCGALNNWFGVCASHTSIAFVRSACKDSTSSHLASLIRLAIGLRCWNITTVGSLSMSSRVVVCNLGRSHVRDDKLGADVILRMNMPPATCDARPWPSQTSLSCQSRLRSSPSRVFLRVACRANHIFPSVSLSISHSSCESCLGLKLRVEDFLLSALWLRA